VPNYFCEITAATSEDEKMAAERILFERLLHLKSQAVETTPHIRMTRG
jgi:hypothetical protein